MLTTNRAGIGGRILQVCLVLAVIAPIVWMFGISLKPAAEPFASPAKLWPSSPTFANYASTLRPQFRTYFLNSSLLSAVTVVVSVSLGLLGAYGLLYTKIRMRLLAITALIAAQMVPAASIIIPIFTATKKLGLVDTHAALMIAYVALTLPVATVMLYTFLRRLPGEILEAARVDGASNTRILLQIVIPLSVPSIIASAVWLTVLVWQEFLFALSMTTSPSMRTLPVGLNDFIGQYGIRYGELMATSMVMSLPVVIMFLALQRYFVQGITAGAVKG